jgi:uncharacterized protein YqeY
MSLYQKAKQLRAETRGKPEQVVACGIITMLLGDLEKDAINGKEFREKLIPLTEDMERPEDPQATKTVDGVEYLITFELVKDDSEITDEKVESKVRKFIKSNVESIKFGHKQSEKFAAENEVLKQFLPAMMDDDTLRQHIASSQATNLGGVMKHLKQFQGLYDGASAKKFAEEYLASK